MPPPAKARTAKARNVNKIVRFTVKRTEEVKLLNLINDHGTILSVVRETLAPHGLVACIYFEIVGQSNWENVQIILHDSTEISWLQTSE